MLAGKKVEPPFKGQADVEYTQPVTKKNGDNVVTTLKVKNMASAPIARLKIAETWFDKGGNIVGAGEAHAGQAARGRARWTRSPSRRRGPRR